MQQFPTLHPGSPVLHLHYTLPLLTRTPAKHHHFKRTTTLRPCRVFQISRIKCRASGAAQTWVPPSKHKRLYWDTTGALPPTPHKATILTLMPYLLKLALAEKQLYWRLAVSLSLVMVSKVTGLMAPLLLKNAVEAVTASKIGVAVQALLVAGLYRLISGIAKEAQTPIFTPIAQAAARKVASNTFAHVLDLDVNFHLNTQSGSLSKVLDRGARSMQMVFRIVVFIFIPTFVELVLISGILGASFGVEVAFIVAGSFLGYIWWTLQLTQIASDLRSEANTFDNLTSGKAIDVLQNFETVTLFDNKGMEVSQYDQYLKGYQNASVESEKVIATMNSGQHAILTCGLTAALVFTTLSATGRPVTSGSLVLVQGLLLQLWLPLQFLGWFYRELRQCLVDMDEYFAILKTESGLPDGDIILPEQTPGAHIPTSHNGEHTRAGNGSGTHGAQTANVVGIDVSFENVKFGYTEERPVLKGLNLSFKSGQSTAIIGSSGSGKSTVLKLLARLYDVTDGSIKFNGIDIRDLQQSSLRSAIGVVPQDTVLFNDTIMENIRYGNPSASNVEVFNAALLAQLHPAISNMPRKYNTVVGERGLKLSGGEKQRVAIARTFLRAPRLLICDEATSSLDTATEQDIMDSLTQLAQGRTSVFVAHRLSTIRNCDRIIVMSRGIVVEQGSHDELMSMGGVYKNMWQSQAGARQRNVNGNTALELEAV